jgi:molecular chaperone Hsp33
MAQDRLIKALSPHKEALIISIHATKTLNESMQRTKAYPPSMLHLGRALMGAALLQALSDLEDGEIVGLHWSTSGPFGGLYAEARSGGKLRGTIDQPQANVEDLSTRLGPGILQVRRSDPNPKVQLSNSGTISAIGDVGIDLVEYLEKSEQRQCGLQMHVKIAFDDSPNAPFPFFVEKAVGYLVHVLPASSKGDFVRTLSSWDEHMKQLGPLSQWVWDEKIDPALQIQQFLLARANPDIRVDSSISFSCTCSEDRAGRALALANKFDSSEIPGSPEKAIIKCEFCGSVYEIPLHSGPSS